VLALTPTDVQGPAVLKVSVADSTGNAVDAAVRVTDLRVTSTNPLPPASITSAYQHKLLGAGGTPPHTFSVKNLPAGLSSDSTGLITGTPTAPVAAADVAITVKDADKTEVTESRKLTVTT
jgi:large repetitive protein